ncbi:hypothetical protein PF003_g22614 [Phytophthora fragariae]|nr:hypothetical protein PF003_g22614 [Phytophthora fragariae]
MRTGIPRRSFLHFLAVFFVDSSASSELCSTCALCTSFCHGAALPWFGFVFSFEELRPISSLCRWNASRGRGFVIISATFAFEATGLISTHRSFTYSRILRSLMLSCLVLRCLPACFINSLALVESQ